jgi:hypothetical protein
MLSRRRALRFAIAGGVAIASTGVALSGPLATTIFAGPGSLGVVVGIQIGPVPTSTEQPEVDQSDQAAAHAAPAPTALVTLSARMLDLNSGQEQALLVPGLRPGDPPLLASGDQLGGATALADGTIALAVSPSASPGGAQARLILLAPQQPTNVPVSGLAADEQLRELVQTSEGRLLGLLMKPSGSPPTSLVEVDASSGAIGRRVPLPATWRFRGMTQSPDGSLFTAGIDRDGGTHLIRLDPRFGGVSEVARLGLADGTSWDNGLDSLLCTDGTPPQFLALAAPRYSTTRGIYRLDARPQGAAVMSPVHTFDAVKAFLTS